MKTTQQNYTKTTNKSKRDAKQRSLYLENRVAEFAHLVDSDPYGRMNWKDSIDQYLLH